MPKIRILAEIEQRDDEDYYYGVRVVINDCTCCDAHGYTADKHVAEAEIIDWLRLWGIPAGTIDDQLFVNGTIPVTYLD